MDAGNGNWLLEKSYQYDKAGHQLSDTTGSQGAITSTYDDVYNPTGVTDRQNATFSFTYDANQNQLSAVDNATGKASFILLWPRGQLAQATNANGGRVKVTPTTQQENLSQQQDSVANQNFTTTYAYTPGNR